MTIRRDLRRLDRDGFVRRTYGGATTRVVRAAGAFEVTQNARTLKHAAEKRWIAHRAAGLAAGARAMFVGVGSTVEQFARVAPAHGGLLVITPSLVVASLLGTRRVQVIIAGGMVRQDELTCVGPAAVECVQRYNTDLAVIGAAGVSARRGVTELDDAEAAVIRAALERAERIVVLADSSKFGDVALSTVVPITRVSAVITDPGADPLEAGRIESEGAEVIVAQPPAPAAAGQGGATTDHGGPLLAAR
jgi:DeoR/GlpR family transcriptional regulator of sugar metabolism